MKVRSLIEGNTIQHEPPYDPSATPIGRIEIYRVSPSHTKAQECRSVFLPLNPADRCDPFRRWAGAIRLYGAAMLNAASSGTFLLGHRAVNRLGYGAMQIAGPGVFGPPRTATSTDL